MERTCDFIRTLTQLYRRLHGRQTRIFQLSSAARGGKLAISALPPLSPAVNYIFQVSSAVRGGKLALSALPPLSSAVNWIFQFSSAVTGGKLAIAALPPLPSAVKSFSSFPPLWEEENWKLHLRCECTWRKSFNPIFCPFFASFACWWLPGRGSVPENDGWTCADDNLVI